ncbi:SpoIIE family protein phosphatase [Desulfosediminicola ganghwensis]|uniref:SpoIIE family protein phosphatase n=1 Tax=Desulfosediminicola ganghwensis TaxID=2569540 RepID=UPI00142ED6CC|nr:SpoIIE family protein phosphatase [Desulfosediminicola ganghwensis]
MRTRHIQHLVLILKSGNLDQLEAGGSQATGMGNIVPFEPGETVPEPDNMLYLYTDGIIEYAFQSYSCQQFRLYGKTRTLTSRSSYANNAETALTGR